MSAGYHLPRDDRTVVRERLECFDESRALANPLLTNRGKKSPYEDPSDRKHCEQRSVIFALS